MRTLVWFIINLIYKYIYGYPTASNINIFWNFGVISGLCLIIQIITGLFLTMYYIPSTDSAMNSIEYMMRNINYGWLVRSAHANGASAFFVAIYIHIFRSLYYGTYSHPNQAVWLVGAIIYFCLMGTAFLGYVLPWGQMSFWGATVITNLITVIPIIGKDILHVVWGGSTICNATLQRCYTFHFVLPFVILFLAALHIYLLHRRGSRHPVAYDTSHSNKVDFFPYLVGRDTIVILVFFMVYIYFVLVEPDFLGHPDNYIDADPCVTPNHIVPEWYFLCMYAILRCIPSKVGGAAAMFIFLCAMIFIPFFSQHIVGNYEHSANRSMFWLGITQLLCLTYLGSKLPVDPFDLLSKICLIMLILIIFNWDIILISLIIFFKYGRASIPVPMARGYVRVRKVKASKTKVAKVDVPKL